MLYVVYCLQESRLANEAAMQVQLDELKVLREKLAAQARQREEMNKINQQLHHYACLEKEEGRLADLKVVSMSQLFDP